MSVLKRKLCEDTHEHFEKQHYENHVNNLANAAHNASAAHAKYQSSDIKAATFRQLLHVFQGHRWLWLHTIFTCLQERIHVTLVQEDHLLQRGM